jgi:hypothetical protein
MEPLGTPEALDRAPARSTVAEAPAPAAPREPLLPERSDDRGSEASFTASSARSFDTLDDLLSRFTLDFKPEYTLKLRHRCAARPARPPARLPARLTAAARLPATGSAPSSSAPT